MTLSGLLFSYTMDEEDSQYQILQSLLADMNNVQCHLNTVMHLSEAKS